MSLPVVTRPAAATEIETAYRWYEKERAGLGFEFLEAVDKLVRTIAENPERSPVIRKDVRRAVLRRFPYSIFYRIVQQVKEDTAGGPQQFPKGIKTGHAERAQSAKSFTKR